MLHNAILGNIKVELTAKDKNEVLLMMMMMMMMMMMIMHN
jgi:hypothetical protein